ncbi:hypothetical protein RvY_03970 [Ramazzottius varieornatus]|uniref:Uncharacterized protein n=1 Tax=Ramazzottius varieornatus TaxID=947166 RepID=A0A1D1UWY6_RAMVA|nr:hypothetical protein RvY_03970 [Ramazzottius varieornatus]
MSTSLAKIPMRSTVEDLVSSGWTEGNDADETRLYPDALYVCGKLFSPDVPTCLGTPLMAKS